MNQAGPVLLAVAALWIAYLVPHRLRYRQELLEARVEDRFSDGLRVLRVADAGGAGTTVRRVGAHRPADRPQVLIHAGGRREGGGPVNRPHAVRDREVADAVRATVEAHAGRAAHLARRRAGARRRALTTLVLLVASVVGWAVVGLTTASVLVALVPSVALAGVLVLGRRAVVAAARADAAWAAGAADRVPLPGARTTPTATGRAVRPSDAETEVIARVRDTGPRGARPRQVEETPVAGPVPSSAPVAREEASGPRPADGRAETGVHVQAPSTADQADEADQPSWVPVPVPLPTYVTKPSAPRREPTPLTEADLAGGVRRPADPVGTRPEETPAEQATAPSVPAAATSAAPRLDLDAILERRRAAGE